MSRPLRWTAIASLALAVATSAAGARASALALVPGGTYQPLYSAGATPVEVGPFRLEIHPVTNAAFLDFVRDVPRWRRSRVTPLFAEAGYLGHWGGDLELGPRAPARAPVTNVSWFAARAYCHFRGRRLPTLDEWEIAALADETRADASGDPAFRRRILDWYGKPTPDPLPEVQQTDRNVHGVFDLHGLVWEWVSDWNSVLVTGESRADGGIDRQLYCAGASARSADPSDYAAFLRYAMRASLEGRYGVRNVGFRCAMDPA